GTSTGSSGRATDRSPTSVPDGVRWNVPHRLRSGRSVGNPAAPGPPTPSKRSSHPPEPLATIAVCGTMTPRRTACRAPEAAARRATDRTPRASHTMAVLTPLQGALFGGLVLACSLAPQAAEAKPRQYGTLFKGEI